MKQISQIKPRESVRVDQERLSALYAQLGESSAEDVVCRAMEELALRLSHCDRLFRTGDMQELRKSARSLIAIAEQIGMDDVSRVANDVTVCVDAQDDVAIAATLQRLMRSGEGSLTAVWDMQDIYI